MQEMFGRELPYPLSGTLQGSCGCRAQGSPRRTQDAHTHRVRSGLCLRGWDYRRRGLHPHQCSSSSVLQGRGATHATRPCHQHIVGDARLVAHSVVRSALVEGRKRDRQSEGAGAMDRCSKQGAAFSRRHLSVSRRQAPSSQVGAKVSAIRSAWWPSSRPAAIRSTGAVCYGATSDELARLSSADRAGLPSCPTTIHRTTTGVRTHAQ